jgi:nucleotide-binding universal stress UspA family protein
LITPAIIKICGVTRPEDAALAAALGADLVGLNFHPPSPRFLDPRRDLSRLLEIAAAAGGLPLVGVFVGLPVAEVEETAAAVGLALVQLHGGEGPEVVARFGARAIKVFRRTGLPSPEELARYADAWGFLFDAPRGRSPPARSIPTEAPGSRGIIEASGSSAPRERRAVRSWSPGASGRELPAPPSRPRVPGESMSAPGSSRPRE